MAEVDGGEIATTNLHSCNGPDFVFQVSFLSELEATPCEGQSGLALITVMCTIIHLLFVVLATKYANGHCSKRSLIYLVLLLFG